MSDFYDEREQTAAKHFILKRYLQTLAFKWLAAGSDELAYVDAFSGPWNSKSEEFSDTSFMIALQVLRDAAAKFRQNGATKIIRCCFVEKEPETFEKLKAAVETFHDPSSGFFVHALCGRFEDVADDVVKLVGRAFTLTFIDPTGWTGYPYEKVGSLLRHAPGEVLLNLMYDFFNRFVASDDPKIISSFDPILGGAGWRTRLDPSLPRGQAAKQLCLAELKRVGLFQHVISTTIDKTASDRPYFSIAYGTRSRHGLLAFRQVEYDALRGHQERRTEARQRSEFQKTGQATLFGPTIELPNQIDIEVSRESERAKSWILSALEAHEYRFDDLVTEILLQFMLRETNVKDICVTLAADQKIQRTWSSSGRRKPADSDVIQLV